MLGQRLEQSHHQFTTILPLSNQLHTVIQDHNVKLSPISSLVQRLAAILYFVQKD